MNSGHEKQVLLKLNMFLGSVYEVIYVNKLLNNRNLNEEEIREMCVSFWGNVGAGRGQDNPETELS